MPSSFNDIRRLGFDVALTLTKLKLVFEAEGHKQDTGVRWEVYCGGGLEERRRDELCDRELGDDTDMLHLLAVERHWQMCVHTWGLIFVYFVYILQTHTHARTHAYKHSYTKLKINLFKKYFMYFTEKSLFQAMK